MGKLLTISIAAYNVENYIRETLDSLCVEDILDKIEVFVVDDGGKDNTLAIAKEYEKKYPNTFHAVHKENGGYGSTVNWCICNATGKYFKLLDGDDFYIKDGLTKLVNFLSRCDADLVLSGRTEIDENGCKKHSNVYWEKLYGAKYNGQTISINELKTPFVYGMWVATFRTKVLKDHYIPLPEHQLYTDRMYIVYSIPWIRSIAFQNYDVYCYRTGHEGQSVSIENRIKHSKEAIDGFNILLEYYKSVNSKIPNNNLRFLNLRIARYYENTIKTILMLPASKKNLLLIKGFENKILLISKELYDCCGRHSKILFALRHTGYLYYWVEKLRKIKNWK